MDLVRVLLLALLCAAASARTLTVSFSSLGSNSMQGIWSSLNRECLDQISELHSTSFESICKQPSRRRLEAYGLQAKLAAVLNGDRQLTNAEQRFTCCSTEWDLNCTKNVLGSACESFYPQLKELSNRMFLTALSIDCDQVTACKDADFEMTPAPEREVKEVEEESDNEVIDIRPAKEEIPVSSTSSFFSPPEVFDDSVTRSSASSQSQSYLLQMMKDQASDTQEKLKMMKDEVMWMRKKMGVDHQKLLEKLDRITRALI